MAWITPKIDWTAGNVPTPGDFNRIEENIQAAYGLADAALYWAQLFRVSARLGFAATLEPNEYIPVQAVRVGIKPRHVLSVRFVSYYLTHPDARLTVWVGEETSHFVTIDGANHFDATSRIGYQEDLYHNDTDGVVYKDVSIGLVGSQSSGIISIGAHAGWSVQLSGAITYDDEPHEE